MGEAGIDRFHIAHVLNHRSVTHSTVTAIYDRYRYDKEKRAALETWGKELDGILKKTARLHLLSKDSSPSRGETLPTAVAVSAARSVVGA